MVLRAAVLSVIAAGLTLAQTAVWSATTPIVLTPSSPATFVYEIQVSGLPTRVTFESALQPGVELPLVDDGSAGDRVAGDRIYTIQLNSAPVLANTKPDDVHRPFIGFVRLYNGASVQVRYNAFAEVAEAGIPDYPVISSGVDFQYTAYLVNIRMPAAFPAGASATIPSQVPIARRFYELLPDDFDVLDIIYSPSYFQNRFHSLARNGVKGIGLPQVETGNTYGSASRLKGISVFPFDGAGIGQQHEFGHQWINYLNVPPVASGMPHWPFSTMASGIMGFSIPPSGEGGNFPCLIVSDGNGIRLDPNPNLPVFSDVDLYLMGLLPASQVSEQIVLNSQDGSATGQCNGKPYSGGFTRFSIADIIANPPIGPRVPDAGSAQKSFRIAAMIVTRDALLTPAEMAFYSFFAKRAELQAPVPTAEGLQKGVVMPFALSTRGLGDMLSVLRLTGVLKAIANGADFTVRPLAPGSFGSIFGTGLGVATASASSLPLPATLGDVAVSINGIAAPLYYLSPTQINFQVPFEVSPGTAIIRVSAAGIVIGSGTLTIVPAAPGVFRDENNHSAALNEDGSFNSSTSPAKPGSNLSVYLTGIGLVSPAVASGKAAPLAPLSRPVLPYSATIDGQPVEVTFLGLAPGLVGAAQANTTIPSLPPGEHSVVIAVGDGKSQGAFVSVGALP